MKRVKLDAYFANNLGDDLMVDIMLRRYPQYTFWVDHSSNATDIFLKYPNFENRRKIAGRYGRLNHIVNILTCYRNEDILLHRIFSRLTRKSRCSVYIGGSLFMESVGDDVKARIVIEEKRLNPKPLFVIGANFGPYVTSDFRDAFVDFFGKCGGVTFRDKKSYSLFQGMSNIDYAPDVVFNLPYHTEETHNNTVVISVVDLQRRSTLAKYTPDYERLISEACRVCVMQGKKPILMSFCDYEGDINAVWRIWENLELPIQQETEIYRYQGCLDEALELFEKAQFVLATRFHAMILALRMNKPFYCISYSDKIKWVLNDLHSNAYCEMHNLNALHIEDILANCKRSVDVTDYMRAAERQFTQFEKYMTNN